MMRTNRVRILLDEAGQDNAVRCVLATGPQQPVFNNKRCDRRPMAKAQKAALALAMTESVDWMDGNN
jgi:hypothetical protein